MKEQPVFLPKIGHSVFVPFVTDGDGNRVKGGAVEPFDKVQAVYGETERSQSGDTVYSVRLESGDAVKIIKRDRYWQSVA